MNTGCTVMTVAGATAGVAVAVTGAAVKTTGAAVGAVIPDSDDDRDEERTKNHEEDENQ